MSKLIVPDHLRKDEEETNVVPFQALPGGKDPTDNWLQRVPQGAVFLCQPRTPKGQLNIFQLEYHLAFKLDMSSKLFENINDEERFFWVDNINFSKAFELVTILFQPVVEDDGPEQEEQENDGTVDRPLQ
jgi:hypothetical protein